MNPGTQFQHSSVWRKSDAMNPGTQFQHSSVWRKSDAMYPGTQFQHSSVWRKSDAMYPGRLGFGTALLGKKSDVNCYEPRQTWFWHSSVGKKVRC